MIQVLQAISLAATAADQLDRASGLLGSVSTVDWMLTTFAIGSLTLSVILFFSVSAAHRHLEQHLKQTITDSAATNARLRQQNDELAAANKELRDTIDVLSESQNQVQENVTGAASS